MLLFVKLRIILHMSNCFIYIHTNAHINVQSMHLYGSDTACLLHIKCTINVRIE